MSQIHPEKFLKFSQTSTTTKLQESVEGDPNFKSYIEQSNWLSFLHFNFARDVIKRVRELSDRNLHFSDLKPLGYKERAQTFENEISSKYFEHRRNNSRKTPTLLIPLLKVFKKQVFLQFILYMIQSGVKVAYAYFLFRVLGAIDDSEESSSTAYKWASFSFICVIVNIYISHHAIFNTVYTANKIKTGLIAMAYQKINKVSLHCLEKASVGKIVNIVANDVNVVEKVNLYISNFVAPFGLIAGTTLLWIFFGPSCLAGIGYIFLTWPFQRKQAKRSLRPRMEKTSVTDDRVKLTNEVLEGIRLLKMYTWEIPYGDAIKKIRSKELKLLKKVGVIEGIIRSVIFSSHVISSFLIFLTYSLQGNKITSEKIFPTLMLMSFLKEVCVLSVAQGLIFLVEMKLLITRVLQIMELPEIEATEDLKYPCNDPENSIEFENFSAYWATQDFNSQIFKQQHYHSWEGSIRRTRSYTFQATLSDINLKIKKGSLTAIIGKIGTGKSTLLLTLTGEVPKTRGFLRYSGSYALVQQEPAIFAGTLRDNILFGKTYEPNYYDEVIDACCLKDDIDTMPKGDLTEIGERGMNLSGGQRARVSLARAIYSRADIYLLDDPLSGIDAKVASRLFRKAILQLLRDKTVILVTHQVHFIKKAERIIVMNEGKIIGDGLYQQLVDDGINVKTLVDVQKKIITKQKSVMELSFSSHSNPSNESLDIKKLKHQRSLRMIKEEVEEEGMSVVDKDHEQFLFDEENVQKKISFKTFKYYFGQIFGWKKLIFVILLFSMTESTNIIFSRILGVWSDDEISQTTALIVLGSLGLASLLLNLVKNTFFVYTTLNGSNKIHHKMLDHVLKSPVKFFNQTPIGRILNRFSNDLGILDRLLPITLFDIMEGMFYCGCQDSCQSEGFTKGDYLQKLTKKISQQLIKPKKSPSLDQIILHSQQFFQKNGEPIQF